MQDPLTLALHVMMGLSLAACTGLRAFLPLLIVGGVARAGHLTLSPDFRFLASDASLLVFAVATVVEMAGDKIPAVDHALDALGTFVKPLAATAVFVSVNSELKPLHAVVLGLLSGGGTAALFHLKKASVRLVSSVGTFGLGNPVLSMAEDLACGAGAVMSVMVPILAFVMVLLVVAMGAWALRHLRASSSSAPRPPA